jgi:DNA topoisomerase I
MEKTLKSGVYLVCPNNKKPAAADEDESPKKRKKKGEEESTVVCAYSKRIGDAPVAEKPTVETHGPLVEQTVS